MFLVVYRLFFTFFEGCCGKRKFKRAEEGYYGVGFRRSLEWRSLGSRFRFSRICFTVETRICVAVLYRFLN